jgi:hypothetical protein
MAEPIVLVHKDLPDAEYVAVNEDQADALKASGWKRKPTTKAATAKTEEK